MSEKAYELLSVQSLHAMLYCERLFYLEEIENVRIADAAVFAGRRLHVELEREDEGEWQQIELQSERLGLRGKVDCLRRRDGSVIPYEHKRGRAARAKFVATVGSDGNSRRASPTNSYEAWVSDKIQVVAYAMLLEETIGQPIMEARVRYHQDNVTVRVAIDEAARVAVHHAIERARLLSSSVERPPVTTNERLCVKCSLAPACLPEESRRAATLVQLESTQTGQSIVAPEEPITAPVAEAHPAPVKRLFPADDKRQSVHVLTNGARVGRSGDQIQITNLDESREHHPAQQVGQIVLHGFSQITTQALRLCAEKAIGVHWLTQAGSYIGSFAAGAGGVQRRIRQYEALREEAFRLRLTRRLAEAKILSQLRFLLRASRDRDREAIGVKDSIEGIRRLMPALRRAADADEIRGVEGRAGTLYFAALPSLIDEGIDERMRPAGRSRRPPRDRFNALIGFGYAMLLKDVMAAILTVGLEPAFGFFHTPRSQAQPLALDLIELFRVAMVDLPIVASVNRRQWDADEDFCVTGQQVWLSDKGRRKLIEIYERRKADEWKHPVLGYSLSYARLIELETRLLEKEWTGEPGLFARMRLR
jgi:CRISPR-associated protein Cas1